MDTLERLQKVAAQRNFEKRAGGMNTIWKGVKEVGGQLVDAAGNVVSSAGNKLTQGADAAKRGLADAAYNVQDKATDLISQGKYYAGQVPDAVMNSSVVANNPTLKAGIQTIGDVGAHLKGGVQNLGDVAGKAMADAPIKAMDLSNPQLASVRGIVRDQAGQADTIARLKATMAARAQDAEALRVQNFNEARRVAEEAKRAAGMETARQVADANQAGAARLKDLAAQNAQEIAAKNGEIGRLGSNYADLEGNYMSAVHNNDALTSSLGHANQLADARGAANGMFTDAANAVGDFASGTGMNIAEGGLAAGLGMAGLGLARKAWNGRRAGQAAAQQAAQQAAQRSRNLKLLAGGAGAAGLGGAYAATRDKAAARNNKKNMIKMMIMNGQL